jgi:hypothetical protein
MLFFHPEYCNESWKETGLDVDAKIIPSVKVVIAVVTLLLFLFFSLLWKCIMLFTSLLIANIAGV